MALLDDFNRANNADVGASWTVVLGGVSGSWFAAQVLSNEFTTGTNAEFCAERYTGGTQPTDDQEASVTMGATMESDATHGCGAIVRCGTGATSNFYYSMANSGAGEVRYGKVVANVQTELGSYTAGATPGTGLKVGPRAVGTRISLYVTDVEVAFTTDAAIASGWLGIMIQPWNAGFPSVDNFSGGNTAPAPVDNTHMWIPPLNHIRG